MDSDLHITEIAPGDGTALSASWLVSAAARDVDAPLLPMEPMEELFVLDADESSTRRQRWLATEGDRAVGTALLVLPDLDNMDAANLTLEVHPDARRRGVGRALLRTAMQRMTAEGRSHVIGQVAEPLDGSGSPGAAFAASVGAERALEEICRSLEFADVSDEQLAALEHEAKAFAVGYDLLQWVGPCSDDVVDDLAALTGRMTTDAPMGDLDWKPEAWDRKRYREAEERSYRLGRRWVTTAARHLVSGRVVAYTDIGWSDRVEGVAFQWMTIVSSEHRGRRLGLLIKTANLRAVRAAMQRPERVITWNAESNARMIAINESLGFRARMRFGQWQLQVPQ